MIDANQAIKIAAGFLRDTSEALGSSPVRLRLEEIGLRPGKVGARRDVWHVTLSYFSGREEADAAELIGEGERLYRQFEVKAENGEVISMEVPEWLRPQLKAG